MAAEKIEHVLSQLLVPDTNVIKQATQELQQLMKDPGIIPVLCTVLASSQNAQVRQYAAVLLRRRIMKARQWKKLSPDVTLSLRQNLLQVLLREPEKSVRKSLAQLIATVARHEIPAGRWPELLQFIEEFTRSQDAQQREVGMYVLSIVASTAAEQLKPHYISLIQLCSASLDEQQNSFVALYAINTLTNLVAYVGSDELKAFQQVVPKILKVVQQLIQTDEELAVEALEVFDELLECEVSILAPHVRSLLEFCMQIGANKQLGSSLRVKCLSIVDTIIRLNKKSLLRLNIVIPLLEVLYPIICEEDDDDDDEFEESESSTAASFACQVLDTMALHLPPEKLIPHLMKPMEVSLQSTDPYQRKAAYLTMALCAEGCADYIRTKLLKELLQQVYNGLQDPVPLVRNAALFALGQFSEFLQPDISKYSAELLPILFDYLGKAAQDVDKDPRGATKTFSTVEAFCENLEKDILPYLPQLMDYLLVIIATSQCLHIKELAISAIGAAANAAKEDLAPYFSKIIKLLMPYLTPTDEEEALKLQTQALDTLSVLARTVIDMFRPLASQCLQIAIKLLTDGTDPDLRRCVYGLLAALSALVKDEMSANLDVIVKQMIEALQSTEGITVHVAGEECDMLDLFAVDEEDIEGSADDEDDDDDDEVKGYSVENSYIAEKADACAALGELAVNIGAPFLAHMEIVFKEVTKILDNPAADIRKAAVAALAQFCICVGNVAKETKAAEAQTVMYTMLSSTLMNFLTIIQEDVDREVSMATLESLAEVIEKIGDPVVQYSGMTDRIISTVKTVLQEKVACQGEDGETEADVDDDKDLSEYDGMLIETAAEILPKICKVVGGENFKPYFAGLLPELIKRLKPSRHISEQSLGVGTIAECLQAMGPATAAFVQHLYPLISKLLGHDDNEVRSNSMFAMGVLAGNGGEAIYSQYPVILKAFFDALNKETDPRAVDNICAAVCRMIMAKTDAVPLEQVLPIVIQCLPLKEDMEENITVYSCVAALYDKQHEQIVKYLPQLLHIMGQVIGTDKLDAETQAIVVNLVRDMNLRYPDVVNQTVNSMPADMVQKLHTCVTSSST